MHISMAFLNPGDGVLVPNPGYPTYTSVSNLVQAEIHTYDLDATNGWHPDFEALGANGFVQGEADVGELPQHAHRRQSHACPF